MSRLLAALQPRARGWELFWLVGMQVLVVLWLSRDTVSLWFDSEERRRAQELHYHTIERDVLTYAIEDMGLISSTVLEPLSPHRSGRGFTQLQTIASYITVPFSALVVIVAYLPLPWIWAADRKRIWSWDARWMAGLLIITGYAYVYFLMQSYIRNPPWMEFNPSSVWAWIYEFLPALFYGLALVILGLWYGKFSRLLIAQVKRPPVAESPAPK